MGRPSYMVLPCIAGCCAVEVRMLLTGIAGIMMQQHFLILALQLSFMLEEAPTSGSVNSTAEEKQHLAAQSLDFNVSFVSRPYMASAGARHA